MRKFGFTLIGLGILQILIVGAYVFATYGPSAPSPASTEEVVEFFDIPILEPTRLPVAPSATPFSPAVVLPTSIPTSTLVPTPTPRVFDWEFGGIDFSSGEEIHVLFDFEDMEIVLEPLVPYIYYSGVIRDIFWDVDNHAIIWTDEEDRLGAWFHSGPGEIIGPFTEYIEKTAEGITRGYLEVDRMLAENVIGSSIYLKQGTEISESVIRAAIRIKPPDVEEVEKHVIDLIPYLQETYDLPEIDALTVEDDVMMWYFCGRLLAGEVVDDSRSYWTQARFIIMLDQPGE